jgi:cob(I)alamin adenosyltransferase
MRLYTGTGDDGTTDLFGGARVAKDHPRVAAYGQADGLGSFLGFAAAACEDGELQAVLRKLQHLVFRLGADLATPPDTGHEAKVQRMADCDVADIEADINAIDGDNAEQRSFVLPGGCECAARLHLARDASRRCERAMVTLAATESGGVSEPALKWINRCSDLLYAMARAANRMAGVPDEPWSGS